MATRVICIEGSYSTDPNAILVHKDSIYNVTEEIIAETVRGSNLWYKLLETGDISKHSSTIFREINDIPELEEELEEILTQ